jgi:error-prone DNA polymerase
MFAELLCRSCFSFLRGASHPEEYVARARELHLSAIALCDRDGLYGSVRALNAASQIGQRVIVGAELSLATAASRRPLQRSRRRGAARSSTIAISDGPTVALLVADHAGYQNLCRLLTLAHADLPKGESALELTWLADHHSGLMAIVPAPRVPGDSETPTDELFATLRDVFRERAFIAMHRHLDGFDRDRAHAVEDWSARFGLPVIASARPVFHHPARKPMADVLYCIRRRTTLDRAGTALMSNTEAYLRSEEQMRELFANRPEWVERTGEIAAQLRFTLSELRYQFPCHLEPGETADEKLRHLTWQGAARRYPGGVPEPIAIQLQKELTLIEGLAVAPYFLSTWEVVEIARSKQILCQGRGSAANSAVCYALGITAVDPARSNLLFERFMSSERREPPDIDIDFEHERREEVIQEIYARYGRDRAAMVSEVICYRGKSALREVGKAFGLSLEQVDRLSGALLHWDATDVSDGHLAEMGFDASDDRLRKVLALARSLQGFPRHLSTHVGGFVLSASPLYEVAPVEPARMENRTVVPWDKDDLEDLGFFKIDVLGLGMLTAIRKALATIHDDGGLRIDETESAGKSPESAAIQARSFDPLEVITRIPAEDPAVYEMVSRADTVGVFQIESRAQMAMLPRLRPQRFYDLVVEVAIVRPGPIQGGMVHPYLRRRAGEEAVTCPHRDLWPILERTLGVPLFQEQVMQIAIEGAGYTGGEADQLRRDMAAWRKNGKLMRHRDRLLDGFERKGIPRHFGEALFEQIKGFGDYGFPESHAASFALIVYASAWQKARYPAHFACALLNAQPMGFYAPSTIIRDAQRHGVEVRDVDVTRSSWDHSLEPCSERDGIQSLAVGARRALRLGLRAIKGLRQASAERIVVERTQRPFSSLEELVRRTRLRKDEVELLAEAGALEPIVAGRRNALWRARGPRTDGLFRDVAPAEPEVSLPGLRAAEQLLLDYRRKGLAIDDHPLRHWRPQLTARGVVCASALDHLDKGRRVSVAGLVLCRQQPGTASGIVFVTLEDETGICNVIFYRRVFEQFHLAARHSTIMLVRGSVERQVTRPPLVLGTGIEATEGPPIAIVHVIAESIERLDRPGDRLPSISRDFH